MTRTRNWIPYDVVVSGETSPGEEYVLDPDVWLSGPDADGLLWVQVGSRDAPLKGAVSIKADSLVGRAFADAFGVALPPPAPPKEAPPDCATCGDGLFVGSTTLGTLRPCPDCGGDGTQTVMSDPVHVSVPCHCRAPKEAPRCVCGGLESQHCHDPQPDERCCEHCAKCHRYRPASKEAEGAAPQTCVECGHVYEQHRPGHGCVADGMGCYCSGWAGRAGRGQ